MEGIISSDTVIRNLLSVASFKSSAEGECPLKKFLFVILFLFVVLSSYSCDVNNEEKAAITFIDSYYAQYENKAEIEDIINSVNPPAEIEAFISDSFDGLLTEKCKNTLVSNRIIPKFDVLESEIIKAEADDHKFSKAENEIDGTLKFYAKVSFKNQDGSSSEKEVTGLIQIVHDNGRYMVDGFKFIQD